MKRASESRPQAPFQRPRPRQPRRPLRRLDPCPHELFGEKKGEWKRCKTKKVMLTPKDNAILSTN